LFDIVGLYGFDFVNNYYLCYFDKLFVVVDGDDDVDVVVEGIELFLGVFE